MDSSQLQSQEFNSAGGETGRGRSSSAISTSGTNHLLSLSGRERYGSAADQLVFLPSIWKRKISVNENYFALPVRKRRKIKSLRVDGQVILEKKTKISLEARLEMVATLMNRMIISTRAADGFVVDKGKERFVYWTFYIGDDFKTFGELIRESETGSSKIEKAFKRPKFIESLAGILISAYVCAEEDLNPGNLGIRIKGDMESECICLDPARHFFPVTCKVFGLRWEHSWTPSRDYTITQRDIDHFPRLQDANPAYFPGRSRPLSSQENTYPQELNNLFLSLEKDKIFIRTKWNTFFHILLIPFNFFRQAFTCISNPDIREKLIEFWDVRLKRLKLILLSDPEFQSFILRDLGSQSEDQYIKNKIKQVMRVLKDGLYENDHDVLKKKYGKNEYISFDDLFNARSDSMEEEIGLRIEEIINICKADEIASNFLLSESKNPYALCIIEFFKKYNLVVRVHGDQGRDRKKSAQVPNVSSLDIERFSISLEVLLNDSSIVQPQAYQQIKQLVGGHLGVLLTDTQAQELIENLLSISICTVPVGSFATTFAPKEFYERVKVCNGGSGIHIYNKNNDSSIQFTCTVNRQLSRSFAINLPAPKILEKTFFSPPPLKSTIIYDQKTNEYRMKKIDGINEFNFGMLIIIAYSMGQTALDISKLRQDLKEKAYQQMEAAQRLLPEGTQHIEIKGYTPCAQQTSDSFISSPSSFFVPLKAGHPCGAEMQFTSPVDAADSRRVTSSIY